MLSYMGYVSCMQPNKPRDKRDPSYQTQLAHNIMTFDDIHPRSHRKNFVSSIYVDSVDYCLPLQAKTR